MLSKKIGLNINNAIMINKIMDEEETEVEAPKERRVKKEEAPAAEEAPQRRTTPQYKVVKKG